MGLAGSGGGNGGGVANSGTLTITNSILSANTAVNPVFGGNSSGGGLENSGTLTITGTTLSGNSAASGGGVESSGTLSITGTTLSGNSAASGGGVENSGTLSITNATLFGNTAVNSGGAIDNSGAALIFFVTADANAATDGGGVSLAAGPSSSFDTVDSIYQNPQGGNVAVASAALFYSGSHNLFSDAPDVVLNSTDAINANPKLGPLADNGGPTQTQALLSNSPAIFAGTSVYGVTTDQRGAPRTSGHPDIGAFQTQPPLTVVYLNHYGLGQHPTVLVLTFDLPLAPGPAQSTANYRLVQGAAGSQVGIPIHSASYTANSYTVTLKPARRLSPGVTYTLTVIGTPPGGLTTTIGAYLSGAGPDQPGTDYVATVPPAQGGRPPR